jgi:hypothetical protein
MAPTLASTRTFDAKHDMLEERRAFEADVRADFEADMHRD